MPAWAIVSHNAPVQQKVLEMTTLPKAGRRRVCPVLFCYLRNFLK